MAQEWTSNDRRVTASAEENVYCKCSMFIANGDEKIDERPNHCPLEFFLGEQQ